MNDHPGLRLAKKNCSNIEGNLVRAFFSFSEKKYTILFTINFEKYTEHGNLKTQKGLLPKKKKKK